MNTTAVVLEQPERLALAGSSSRRPATTTSSSRSSGAASAPAPSACSGPAACRRFPAWAIRWCRATNPSGAWSKPARAPAARVGDTRVRARRTLLRRRARAVRRRRGASGGAGRARGAGRRATWASRACCWRWPRRPITRMARRRQPRSDLIVGHGVLGRLLARAGGGRRRAPPDGVGAQPGAARRRRGLSGGRSRRRSRGATIARSTT